jgi:CBS domain-containing protein
MLLLNVAQAARSDAQLHKHLGGRTVASVMTPHPVTVGPEASLSEVVDAIILERGRSFVPVVAQGRLVGVVAAEAIRRTSRDLWPTTRIRQVMEPLGPENTIEPDAASDMVLHHMARTGRHKLVVARQGVLVGVVTLGDLLNYLGIVQLFKDRLPDSKTKSLRRRANGIHEHPLSRMIHPKCKILSADRLL